LRFRGTLAEEGDPVAVDDAAREQARRLPAVALLRRPGLDTVPIVLLELRCALFCRTLSRER
jgi:hypothetical protein